MKRSNSLAILFILAAICFIAEFIISGGSRYLILGCIWIIIGIVRIIRPPIKKR